MGNDEGKRGTVLADLAGNAKRLHRSPLVRNTIYYGMNFSLQIFTQFGFFALISRALGPGGYGIFASVSAVALMVSVFVGWGSDHLLIQRVAVNRDQFAEYFGRALVLIGATLLPAIAFAFFVLYFLETTNLSAWGILALIVAECAFRKITFLGSASYMAHDRAGKQFLIDNGSLILRLVAILALFLSFDIVTIDMWAMAYLTASAFAALVTMTMVLRDFGRPKFVFTGFDFKLGLLFSLEFASVSGLRDMDKPVIVQALGAEHAGLYTAAFRIIDAATAPVRAVLYATYTRYFRHADKGAEHGIAFGIRVMPFILGIGVLVGVFVFFVAGYVPLLIGSEYQESVGLIRMLAIYPLLLGAAGIGADIMRSIGMQGTRVVLIFLSNFAIVGVVWAGCVYGGLEGAVASRMGLQIAIVFTTWAIIGRRKKNP
ncbi:lipopolysaccharide biosynthesis protein [Oricola nitratireducens]|uniref:lipopolysaccharide biosynthesis protein n=1 Tax=Oricola nitratireducens TaxID=2775868 RepID=UPI00186854EC|nr:lipopolysaccharide biosynthesis protein [Oricola nitratireducens]